MGNMWYAVAMACYCMHGTSLCHVAPMCAPAPPTSPSPPNPKAVERRVTQLSKLPINHTEDTQVQ